MLNYGPLEIRLLVISYKGRAIALSLVLPAPTDGPVSLFFHIRAAIRILLFRQPNTIMYVL